MTEEVVIIIAEDDAGHARLIQKNLGRVGLHNPVQFFENGQDVLDFLFRRGPGPHRKSDTAYLLMLDIRMPKVDGVEALRIAEAHPGPIHLLLTDVVMPNVGGRDLAEALHALRPETRVLFMTGFTDDAIVRHGVSAAEGALLQKPFTPANLARKVRSVLDAAPTPRSR